VSEVILRLTGVVPGRGGVFTASSDEFEQIPGIFGPNQDTMANQIPNLRYRVRINRLGYRGQDFPRSKPDREFRILYAGDSFAFGDFVDDEETLPAQTERALGIRCSDPVRIINAGLGGSTITEHTELIERGLSIDPDLVILQFSENDVSDLAGESMWDRLAWNRQTKSAFPFSAIYPHIRNSALWTLTLRASARIRDWRAARSLLGSAKDSEGAGDSEGPPDESAERESIDQLRMQYRERLIRLRSFLTARGIPMIMTVMPSHLSVYNHRESDQLEWLETMLSELEIDVVSFFPTFLDDGRGETELYLLPYDGHTSPEGYRIAAQQLSTRLISLDPLSEHCAPAPRFSDFPTRTGDLLPRADPLRPGLPEP
jgi:lysophospholipase L1-like esterase